MKLENIRENFTFMNETAQRNFFLNYYEKRKNDLELKIEIKTKKSKAATKTKSTDTITVTKEQLEVFKLLGLI